MSSDETDGRVGTGVVASGEDCNDGSELNQVLSRRQKINDGEIAGENKMKVKKNSLSVYYDNQDMDKTTIDQIKTKFEEFDLDGNGKLDEYELTKLFEKLGSPNNLLQVRALIRAADKTGDGCLNLEEFVSIFRKVASEQLDETSALLAFVQMTEIDVSKCRVKGAKNFFEWQIKKSQDSSFSKMIEEENRRKKEEEEERKRKKQDMARKISAFEQGGSS